MKKIIAISLVLTAILFAFVNNSEARSIKRYVSAEIISMDLDPNGRLTELVIDEANVLIDYFKRSIGLNFRLGLSCPAGAHCSMEVRGKTITLPIISRKVNRCGVVTYIGKRNKLPLDGTLSVIKVVNNSGNKCFIPGYLLGPLTDIKYTTKYYDRRNRRVVTTIDRFEAETLR